MNPTLKIAKLEDDTVDGDSIPGADGQSVIADPTALTPAVLSAAAADPSLIAQAFGITAPVRTPRSAPVVKGAKTTTTTLPPKPVGEKAKSWGFGSLPAELARAVEAAVGMIHPAS